MSVYQRLADFLIDQKADHWDASFAEVEHVLGRSLPVSASRHPAWWANQSGEGHSQTRGWRGAGWKTTKLDLQCRRVRFERECAGTTGSVAGKTKLDVLIHRAGEVMGISDRDRIMCMALEMAIARAGGAQLAALGGTMPDYQAPDRERA